jgi:hypothetical protein
MKKRVWPDPQHRDGREDQRAPATAQELGSRIDEKSDQLHQRAIIVCKYYSGKSALVCRASNRFARIPTASNSKRFKPQTVMAAPTPNLPSRINNSIRRAAFASCCWQLLRPLLFTLLFVQQAFDTLRWWRPDSASETFILFALSTFNFLAFIVLLMVLARNIIKLRREQKAGKLGARFKNRLVFYFVALSLLPVLFLFFATRGFINRSIDKWFGLPVDELKTNAIYIQSEYLKGELNELERTAATLGRLLLRVPAELSAQTLADEAAEQQLEWSQLWDKKSG